MNLFLLPAHEMSPSPIFSIGENNSGGTSTTNPHRPKLLPGGAQQVPLWTPRHLIPVDRLNYQGIIIGKDPGRDFFRWVHFRPWEATPESKSYCRR